MTTTKTYDPEAIKCAVRLQRELDNALTTFLPNYFGDDRIANLDDCFKYLLGECEDDQKKEIEETLLDGVATHSDEVFENRKMARKVIADILKNTFNEIIDYVVEAETCEDAGAAWNELNNQTILPAHSEFFGSTSEPMVIETNMEGNPFAFIQDFYDWNNIADLYMDKGTYAVLDRIYMHFVEGNKDVEILNENGTPMTDDEMIDLYNKEMGAFIKKAVREMDIALQNAKFDFFV